jgi:photosystem II stability/assembly factor-like uncharacterized protein
MKKIVIGLVIITTAVLLLVATRPSQQDNQAAQTETNIKLRDAHGLSVDREDSSRVYIATHTGLLAMVDDSELVQVSADMDDYMGFSAHPTDANIFYTSGHLSSGGNIGFQKSLDGGKTWVKISDGYEGPVDFHSMTVSQANPNVIYGTYKGQLQLSTNEGRDWDKVQSAPAGIYTLATSPDDENIIYAGTSNGLQVSRDKGATWEGVGLDGAIASLVVNPGDGKKIVTYVVDAGLMKTSDAGKSWQVIEGYASSLVTQLAYDSQNTNVIYAINQSLEIYKTIDGANSWSKVR